MAVSDRLGGFVFPGYDPMQVPNSPTNVAATALSASVVTFTAPSDVGGGAITSYVASATTTSGVTVSVSGGASPLTFSGLVIGTDYTVQVTAFNEFGPSAPSTGVSVTPQIVGQSAYTTAGTFSWVAPSGVTSVSVVAIGGGGGSLNGSPNYNGGGGGGLGYKNNLTVVPGSSYTVVVGAGGSGAAGGDSYFIDTSTVKGGAGGIGSGGSRTGDGGARHQSSCVCSQ